MTERVLGIDVGAETIKIVELSRRVRSREMDGILHWTRRLCVDHGKEPAKVLPLLLADFGWSGLAGARVTGRFSRSVQLPRLPPKAARIAGTRHLLGHEPVTVVSIGGHGFSTLEVRERGAHVLRENSRCSQGTGSFLRQLVLRFGIAVEEASQIVEDVTDPAPLSGRCPVILKTDMTHLANKGVCRASILAGLYDAVCENVLVLLKPGVSPPRVLLSGGVARSRRVRRNVARFLETRGFSLIDLPIDDSLYVDALGCALAALDAPLPLPALDALVSPVARHALPAAPALKDALHRVTRMSPRPRAPGRGMGTAHDRERRVVMGLDLGSTGSKALVLDATTHEMLWHEYTETGGDPVGAAQRLVATLATSPAAGFPVVAVGVTGSGREIAGSLLRTCYGDSPVFVLNEIAAHAAGAYHYDPRVDTIFEIGGQDAKYIRLAEGRVVDAAMNEACSAGTGSFIAEQGGRFAGIRDIEDITGKALAADRGVSLGQHCSVFMAEIIDEAIAAGEGTGPILAGLHHSVIQNYLHRVKGARDVGSVIFCQGMPFASDALAAAVAHQTGAEIVVPPHPGLVGALGIALLAARELAIDAQEPLDLARFQRAIVEKRDTFVCTSTRGCGGLGNKCRIDRIHTVVEGTRQRFVWGGACSLYDRGAAGRKLPDGAPDPFRRREELVADVVRRAAVSRGRRRIALADSFSIKPLFPFFATFLSELGWDIAIHEGDGREALKRGIERAHVPFCAPMQQYHGMATEIAASDAERIFLPRLRSLPRMGPEPHATTCPIAQASPEVLRLDLDDGARGRLLTPLIDFGAEGFDSVAFRASCDAIARELGAGTRRATLAREHARTVQEDFDRALLTAGEEAIEFSRAYGLIPVVVLGRVYTIYDAVLNSNVPALLREQGVMPIPLDAYPIDDTVPFIDDMYWSYGQRLLRAAHQIRRTHGVYSVFCSNYSCGPDSFTLSFFAYAMQGKPYAVVETDGHSGDAGTKTRLEAFLHCAREHLAGAVEERAAPDFRALDRMETRLATLRDSGETLLVPRLSNSIEALAACLRGTGIAALPMSEPDEEDLREGRRHTSGKECLPMQVTLGTVLRHVGKTRDGLGRGQRISILMPSTHGPCRFGCYKKLYELVAERIGADDLIRIFSPADRNYFSEAGSGFSGLAMAGMAAYDMLEAARLHVRPVEREPGAADSIHARFSARLITLLEREAGRCIAASKTILEVMTGRLFGCRALLEDAARDFAAAIGQGDPPTVLVVGEIFVRFDPLSSGNLVRELEKRGLRIRMAPLTGWFEYTGDLALERGDKRGAAAWASNQLSHSILEQCWNIVARTLGLPRRTSAAEAVDAARDYLRPDLWGEAVLTLGEPIHEWRAGTIDGAIAVGPHECMPSKLAETQFFHAAEREGLKVLTLAFNGDPLDPEILDNFAYEVHADAKRRGDAGREPSAGIFEATPAHCTSPCLGTDCP